MGKSVDSFFYKTECGIIENNNISRNALCPSNKMSPYYLENFDSKTFWYDAIQDANLIRLVCPKLRNFEKEIKNGSFFLDDARVDRFEIKRFRRTDILTIKTSSFAEKIKFESNSLGLSSELSKTDFSIADKKNCAMVINKNNNLEWIEYFAKWHVKFHNLQCLFILDNNSSNYTNKDVQIVLENSGLDSLVILNLPFNFGPASLGRPYHNRELFLQTSAYNILKFRFLKNARAVLCCDIDELVLPSDTNIFDATIKSKYGFLRFLGKFRYHNFASTQKVSHQSSFYKLDDNNSAEKWCIDPKGKLGDYSWTTHSLENLFFERRFFSKKFSFFHCINVTTGWKGGRQKPSDQLVLDNFTQDLMDSV